MIVEKQLKTFVWFKSQKVIKPQTFDSHFSSIPKEKSRPHTQNLKIWDPCTVQQPWAR